LEHYAGTARVAALEADLSADELDLTLHPRLLLLASGEAPVMPTLLEQLDDYGVQGGELAFDELRLFTWEASP
jgi:hypothetical protein